MRIVFEGADLVGKSTLAQLFAKCAEMPYRGRITKALSEQIQVNKEDLEKHHKHVLDRCYWMTDLMYTRTVSKPSVFDYPADIVTQLYSSIYIICICSDVEEHRYRYDNRPDDLWSFAEVQRYQLEYQRFANSMSACPTLMVLDTASKSMEQCVNEVAAFVIETRRKYGFLFGGGICRV